MSRPTVCRGLFCLLLGLFALAGRAEPVTGLYETDVPVASQDEQARAAAAQAGLRAVLLKVAGAARVSSWPPAARWAPTMLLLLCAALPALGLINAFAPLYLPRLAAQDAVQNVTEWWAGSVFSLFFVVVARLWSATGFGARLYVASTLPRAREN